MGFQLIRLGWLITTFHIRRLRGLIKPVLAIKKQHQPVMMMFRQFRAHLSKFKVLLLTRYSIILDHQCSMCNSRQDKFKIKWLILAHQAKYHRWLKKIAPSVQRIRRDMDPNVYNQRLQIASQQRTQQIEIPQGHHYGINYNTLYMIPNPRYQGTRNFNPQMGSAIAKKSRFKY